MKMIKSFQVDHDKLTKGMYVSRIDGDCITYDIRMVTPNGGVYLENDGLHTFEHLFATMCGILLFLMRLSMSARWDAVPVFTLLPVTVFHAVRHWNW